MRSQRASFARLTGCAAVLAAIGTVAVTVPGAGAVAKKLPVVYNILSARPGAETSPPGANDFSCRPSRAHPDPVVLVHGLGATAGENWGTMAPLLKNNGYCVFALTYGLAAGEKFVGGVTRMEDSSAELAAFVDRVRTATGAAKVDLVGHSEGTVMPQYYLKFRGGAAKVGKYVAITPLYQGTTMDGIGAFVATLERAYPQLSGPISDAFDRFCGSCQEFLRGSRFLHHLYRDGVYAVPGVTYT